MAVEIRLAEVPAEPGVYLFRRGEEEVLYVGKAGNLKARLSQYRPGEIDPRKEGLLERAERVEFILTRSEKEALLLESSLIKRHLPRYNVRLTDDKRYPYIRLSDDPYPRVSITRDTRRAGATFGPFPDAGAARRTIQALREAFKLRDCKELIPGGCLNFQMDLCSAPCIKDAAERARKAPRSSLAAIDVDAEYAASVEEATAFLRGDAARLTREFQAEMDAAAKREDFERAAVMRDRLQAVTRTLERQSIFSRGTEDRDAFVLARDGALACGVVVLVRDRNVVGQEHFFFRKTAAEVSDAELMAQFIQRYYEHLPTVPREILVSVTPTEAETLAALLSERRQARVEIVAPTRGDARRTIDLALKNAEFKIAQERLRRGEEDGVRELAELQQALGLAQPPTRIECFDISHFAGTGVVASMSVLENARPASREYRRFKIRLDKNDDFAAMEEVVSRRYSRVIREETPLPGLVLIDGGPGQLASATRALADLGLAHVPVAALAKREEEVYLPGRVRPLDLAKGSLALHVLMRARDEAHRFAVKYQRAKRAQTLTKSVLDDLPGVGESKKRALLAHFGTVEDVARASEEDLARVPGIGKALARVIRERLGS